MTTFDGWDSQLMSNTLPVSEELMHFRTKGSKNGVRRYQQSDGTWTPLGLRERKQREGWGDSSRSERRAEKQVAKAERRAARSERKAARAAKRSEFISKYKEKRRQNSLKGLSDAELKKKIERVKMEQEYKELTRSPVLKSGEKLVTSILEAKARKADRALEKARLDLDNRRVTADIIKARESSKKTKAEASKAKQEAKKAKQEAVKMKYDEMAGKKLERKKELINAKLAYKQHTLRGGIVNRWNTKMTAGLKDKIEKIRKAEGESEANRMKAKAARDLNKEKKAWKKEEQEQEIKERKEGIKSYEKQQAKLRKERLKVQSQYEAEAKRRNKEAEERAARSERERQAREAQRERERKALEAERERERKAREAAREREEEARRRKAAKRERQLQRAYDREITRYDETARRMNHF